MSTTLQRPRSGFAVACAATLAGLLLPVAATPANAAMTEIYYQKDFQLTCVANLCGVELPKVAEKTRVKVTRISCLLVAQSTAGVGYANYQYGGNNNTLTQYLAPVQVDSTTAIFNQPTDILIPAKKHLQIALTAQGKTNDAHCSVTGRLQKFS